MNDYTNRLLRRKIPTLIFTVLILLIGAIVKAFAG